MIFLSFIFPLFFFFFLWNCFHFSINISRIHWKLPIPISQRMKSGSFEKTPKRTLSNDARLSITNSKQGKECILMKYRKQKYHKRKIIVLWKHQNVKKQRTNEFFDETYKSKKNQRNSRWFYEKKIRTERAKKQVFF